MRQLALSLLFTLFSAPLLALQSGVEDTLLIVDPGDMEGVYVAQYYAAARGLHPSRILWMDPTAANYAEQVAVQVAGFLGHLEQTGLSGQIDLVVLPPLTESVVSSSGYVSDGCSPVNRFSVPAAFTLAHVSNKVLGGLSSTSSNHFGSGLYAALAFDSNESWRFGSPSTHAQAERYYIGATLGWTGNHGTDVGEILAMIDRSVAVDGTLPAGTVYYMETTDPARSGPRHGHYPTAVNQMAQAGGLGAHLMADLPLGQHDVMGLMTGRANLPISTANMTLLPGSFADHLTSYAATFWNNSQTKMTRWIEKGASGTAGTIEEPCNYAGKFNRALLHVVYRSGLSLGEAWFRSLAYKPFQNLFLGDPLTRPYSLPPTVDLSMVPTTAIGGLLQFIPTSSATAPGAQVARLELFIDGVRVDSTAPGVPFELDTQLLAEGFHELRVRALDDTPVQHAGEATVHILIDNAPESLVVDAQLTSGDLSTLFPFAWTSPGGAAPLEVRLIAGGRVIATGAGPAGTLEAYGWNLGAGPVRGWLECDWPAGRIGRSEEFDVDVAYTAGTPSGVAPAAHAYTRRVSTEAVFVIELPAVFDDDPGLASFDLVTPPAQSDRLSPGDGAWQVFRPQFGATGSDQLVFRVTTPSGASGLATITILYEPSCPPPLRHCVGASNSAGPGASLEVLGSTSLASNDLVLEARDVPAGQNGFFFQGSDPIQQPLGNGFLCIGANHARYPVVQAAATGTAMLAIDYGNPPLVGAQITAGSTWSFQFWYRDPGVGAGSNTTDALELTFCP